VVLRNREPVYRNSNFKFFLSITFSAGFDFEIRAPQQIAANAVLRCCQGWILESEFVRVLKNSPWTTADRYPEAADGLVLAVRPRLSIGCGSRGAYPTARDDCISEKVAAVCARDAGT
jgi:hypothetical protein